MRSGAASSTEGNSFQSRERVFEELYAAVQAACEQQPEFRHKLITGHIY